MHNETQYLKKLFDQKKYKKIIFTIENKIDSQDYNSGLLNLRGVCKILLDYSKDTLESSIKDFREAYLKEKTTTNALEALKNFINISMDLFDIEFRSGDNKFSEDIFNEIHSYFQENRGLFENNDDFNKAIIRVFKRKLDLENVISQLKKLSMEDPYNISALIYYNCFNKNWTQKDFFEKSKFLAKQLPLYSKSDLIELEKNTQKKINVAFLSADIRGSHSVTYFLKTILFNYDRDKYNVVLILNNNKEDAILQDLKKVVDKIINIFHLSDIEAINYIRSQKIDIIFDMMGVTSDHRLSLFKNRLAPTQISWCGYCNTTGLKEMDFIIADKNLIFEKEKNLYSEKIIYLQNIWNCHPGFDFRREEQSTPYLKNKYITFGSFNNFRKINNNVIKVWSEILIKIKNSKLILKASDSVSNKLLINKFKQYGVDQFIDFIPYRVKFEEHLKEYQNIDIALDTFPYNGVTTSFEAIWMGVPVLTMAGYNFNSRCGESINKNLDLVDLIAVNEKDYVLKLINLFENDQKLLDIRKKIFDESISSSLFDSKKFTQDFFNKVIKNYNF